LLRHCCATLRRVCVRGETTLAELEQLRIARCDD
jgi:hypothetical protein